MRNPKNSSLVNPNYIKTRLAARFLRSMKKLSKKEPSSPSVSEKYRRYHLIRAAAYASMAAAVGPRRAWSRAVLRKIKNRKLVISQKPGYPHTRGNPRNNLGVGHGHGHENDLRELVPGGEGMDFSRLLNETGHYIKCLRAQVELMRKIVDFTSI